MNRGMRDIDRTMLGGDYDDLRGYSRAGGSYGGDRYREGGFMGSSGGYGHGSGALGSSPSSYGFERELMEGYMHQRALHQQLTLRESQLALANSLLKQQQRVQMMNKRRTDYRLDGQRDFKRPRNDFRARPRERQRARNSESSNRSGSGGQNQNSSSRNANRRSSDKSKDSAQGEKAASETANKDKETGDEAGKDRKQKAKGHCNVCDVPLTTSFMHHQRLSFHKKRRIQVTKGCGWCGVKNFKNFSEVLTHRETDQHVKNQKKHDEDRGEDKSRSGAKPQKKREPLKFEMPAELAKYDPTVVTGQSCVVAVTGWFCKLCNKFYNNETAAKETHCMTEPHFTNYKKLVYTKLKAKAEEERAAKEKAEEEAEEKRKAEEAAAAAEAAAVTAEEKGENAGEEEAEGGADVEEGMEEGGDEGEEVTQAGEEEAVNEEEDMGEEETEEAALEGEDWEQPQEIGEEQPADEEALLAPGLAEEVNEALDEDLSAVADLGEAGQNESAEGLDSSEAMEEEMEADVCPDTEQQTPTKTTPGRGRGRGGSANRARRGRKISK